MVKKLFWVTYTCFIYLICNGSYAFAKTSGNLDIRRLYLDHSNKKQNHHRNSELNWIQTNKESVTDKKLSAIAAKAQSQPSSSPNESLPTYMKIFPVKLNEFPKFISLSMMMFWIVFVFTMTRDTKDALIVTNCGAESIAFLKVYGVIPAATGFMILYAKLSSILSTKTLFYVTLLPFFVFYSAFAFILYPLRNYLHPLSIAVPKGGLSYAVNLLRHWTFSLYFIVSELWGSAGVPLLFWSCANDVIKVDQAARLYPIIPMIGNLGPIFSGIAMSSVSTYIKKFIKDDDKAFEASLKVLTLFMIVAGGLITLCHHFIREIQAKEIANHSIIVLSNNESKNENKSNNKNTKDPSKSTKEKSQEIGRHLSEPKLTLIQSLHFLATDKYLRNVAIMVLSYGLTMEFTEIIWKATVKKAFPIRSDYLAFNGRTSTLVGMSSFIMMIVGVNVVKVLGWQAGALMTPMMMGLLAAPFFASLIFGIGTGSTSPDAAQKALLVAVYVGLVQNVLSKGTKYAIFDPTKEMTYIPLDKDSKTKGKAAIDVLGARLGKSGGALAQQFLVVIFGNIIRGAPVLAVLFYLVIVAWIAALSDLSPMFKTKVETSKKMG